MPPAVDNRKIGQILIDRGIITPLQLEEALGEQGLTGRFFGEILVGRGVVTEERIAKALSEQLGFGYVDMKEIIIEPKALEKVTNEICKKYVLIPIYHSQSALTVAMANALDVIAIDKLQGLTGLRIRPVFACPSEIRRAIEKSDLRGESDKEIVPKGGKVITVEPVGKASGVFIEREVIAAHENTKPVIERVNQVIGTAVEMGASDVHLEPEKRKFVCRYRVDGILHVQPAIPFEEYAAVLSRIKIMADMDIAEKRLPQDGRIRLKLESREVDLRVSTFPSIYGENMVIRILDRSSGLLGIEDLGFSAQNMEDFRKLVRKSYGMILVTGPTGSGKTTALYAAISELNSEEKNIITLEDPVEYEIPNIRQSQINVKAGLTFALGLRSIVRQDPDIIMIGEIRDKETADIAIHAALTGHLVLSTLHTNDAPSAAARLIDMGVEPFLVASSIIGILAQRLIRTLCPVCKQSYSPPKELLEQLEYDGPTEGLLFYKEVGCVKCKNYGYSGRSGIYELLIPNERTRDLITKKATASAILEEAQRSAGMKTLRQAGIEKVIMGTTSVSEILRVTEVITG